MKERREEGLEEARTFEEEYLLGEATDTIEALLESLGIRQRELAQRLGISEARVSQILSGRENLTLRSLAALGWALGVRFRLAPNAIDRYSTPADQDAPLPDWLETLRESASKEPQTPFVSSQGRKRRPGGAKARN